MLFPFVKMAEEHGCVAIHLNYSHNKAVLMTGHYKHFKSGIPQVCQILVFQQY